MAEVLFFTDGPPAAQSVVHRVNFTAEYLATRGHRVQILYGRAQALFGRRFSRASLPSLVRLILSIPSADVFVIHRAGDPLTAAITSLFRKRGGRVMVDLDDAVYLNRNLLTLSINYLLRSSDRVTVSSHAIASYCTQLTGKVTRIPAPVDTALFSRSSVVSARSIPTIGWLGDGRVHADNLKVLVSPLTRLARTHRFKLKLVSALGNPKIHDSFSKLATQVEIDYGSKSWVDLSRIPGMIEDFDISVMPLVDNGYSRAKAGQKILESMSMGVPVVASSIGENPFIVSHGIDGFLASSDDEWVRHLDHLLKDPGLRAVMGAEGRKKVMNHYSREICGELFTKALVACLPHKRR